MKIETNQNVAEGGSSLTAPGLMVVLPGKPLYVYVANQKAKQVSLPIFMIVAPTCNAPRASYTRVMTGHARWKARVRPRRKATQLAT